MAATTMLPASVYGTPGSKAGTKPPGNWFPFFRKNAPNVTVVAR
jgi:hypothetical protein